MKTSCRFSPGAALLLALAMPVARATNLEDWAKMEPIVPRHYVCARAHGPVTIDGHIDDRAWQDAPWTEDFVDIEGDAKPRPKFRTRAKLLWDNDYLYIAAELEEPDVWGTLTQHDSIIFRDPDFEVFLNPDGSSHEYYEFEMNALNTGWDLYLAKPYKDGGKAEDEWNIPGLKTAVQVRGTLNHPGDKDQGWTVEIAFPWKGFSRHTNRQGMPPRDGDQWRLGFSRVEWQINTTSGAYQKLPGIPENNWIWSPQGIVDMHRPEKWGYLQFTSTPGTAQFKPDETAPARMALQHIYYAQRDFQKRTGHWATSLAELGLTNLNTDKRFELIDLQGSAEKYTATAVLKDRTGKTRRIHLRQDAKVWED